ncbi:MAG: DM13 domain-containing protein [Candidatus Jorgensenbacteria bacterium]|nr:DM13 domain-containing protein [Candidatus Jorgensenbacteria bacterium]
MMRKILIAIAILLALGVAYWLIAPLFTEERVSESLSDIMRRPSAPQADGSAGSPQGMPPEIVRQGTFVSLAGHSAEGTATLVKAGEKYYVRFEDDFEMTNGPDLFVHFGKNDAYAAEARLGALKGNVGGQNYEVPEGIDPLTYDEVWVWCRAFAVPFGKAVLVEAD